METRNKNEQALYEAILRLKTPQECALLFEDLCTHKEVEQMAMRLAAAVLLMQGETYAEVMEKVDISSATLSRVSRCVQCGQGYNRFALPPKEAEKIQAAASELQA